MLVVFLDALIPLLPLIVLFSGMAMTPLLMVMALLIVIAVSNASLRAPERALVNYKYLVAVLAVVLLWPVISSLWSITPERSLGTALRVLGVYIAGAAAFIYIPALKPVSPRVLGWYAGVTVAVGVLILLERVPGGGLIRAFDSAAHIDYDRFMAKNINRGLCALSVLIWPLMFGLLQLGRRRLAWVTFTILALGILSMHSLSAKVGLVAGLIAFFSIRRFPVVVPRAVLILFPLFLLSFPLLFLLLEHTFFAIPMVDDHLPLSAIHRLHIWHELMEMAKQKLFLGWGMDTSRAMPLTEEVLEYLNLTEPPLHPHSPSLQLLLELGITGLVLACGGLFLLLREWVRMPIALELRRATAGALIVAYFAAGVSSFGIWQHWWIAVLWIAAMFWRRMGLIETSPSIAQ